MKQAIAGVVPAQLAEVNAKTVWPTIGATRLGRWTARLADLGKARGPLGVGRLLALATIPFALAAYAWQLLPWGMRRYRITNRRVVIQTGLKARDAASVALDGFDDVRIDVLPGQAYLHCGDVVFLRQGQEVLRLAGVPRPETFRALCQESRAAYTSVAAVLAVRSA